MRFKVQRNGKESVTFDAHCWPDATAKVAKAISNVAKEGRLNTLTSVTITAEPSPSFGYDIGNARSNPSWR